MKYLEFTFTVTPCTEAAHDVLAAVLAEAGFDSFVHTNELDLPRVALADNFPESPIFAPKADTDKFKAYIPEATFSQAALSEAIDNFPLPGVSISYERCEAEDKDWNEEWEKNYFKPLVVGPASAPRCVVAGTFHKDVPQAIYNITIDPRMAFGTGHHATTAQMMGRILDDDMAGLEVLDMGCGTSILAILARMRGARHCVAIDNDEWCVKNSLDNLALNHIDNVDVLLGDAAWLEDKKEMFHLIIANINRNILMRDLPLYVPALKSGGTIYMSGFYTADVARIREVAEREGLAFVDERSTDNWACIKLQKP